MASDVSDSCGHRTADFFYYFPLYVLSWVSKQRFHTFVCPEFGNKTLFNTFLTPISFFSSSELGNKTTISYLPVQQSKLSHSLLWMTKCTVALGLSASCNSAFGHPQHLGDDSFDCSTDRYEIY